MTRDEIVAALDKLLDETWQMGWDEGADEGYRRGLEDADASV